MLGFGKSIRPNEIDAVISKFTNCFDIIKENNAGVYKSREVFHEFLILMMMY